MSADDRQGVPAERHVIGSPAARSAAAGHCVIVVVESELAMPAALWAARQCRRTHGALRMVVPAGSTASSQQTAEDVLQHVEAGVQREEPGVDIDRGLLMGGSVDSLIEMSHDAAMIVVADGGPQRRRSEADSPSWALAARGACPVVVWRCTRPWSPSAPVVVGIDGSPISAGALEFGLTQASWLGAPLVAVMAWSDVYLDVERQLLGTVTDWRAVADDYRRLFAEQLAGAQERFPDVVIERVLTQDRPVRALLAESACAQLLVVGSRGRGGFPAMLLGSVSRALVDYSPCPIAVVRPVDETAAE